MVATSSTNGAGATGGFCAGLQEWWSGVTSGLKENLTNTGIAGPSTNGAGSTTDLPIEVIQAKCPIPVIVKVTTRVGDIPVPGVKVFCGGETKAALIGTTGSDGLTPLGQGNACDDQATIWVFYKNDDARLKLEQVRFQITGIRKGGGGVTAATGGQVEHTIEKILDAYGTKSDKNFVNQYSGAELVNIQDGKLAVSIKLATLSLSVPYISQNMGNESVNGHVFSGSILCGPTSHTMLLNYWGIDVTRNQWMQATNPTSSRSRPWAGNAQRIKTTGRFVSSSGKGLKVKGSDLSEGNYDNYLAKGCPVITSTWATGDSGHIMIVRGVVQKNDGTTSWFIMNDPYGNLASQFSIYDSSMDLSGSVGAGGVNASADVVKVQDYLNSYGIYSGSSSGTMDEPTISAIKKFQQAVGLSSPDGLISRNGTTHRKILGSSSYSGIEQELTKMGSKEDRRGEHVYYNGSVEAAGNAAGTGGRFVIKGPPWTAYIVPNSSFSKAELSQKIVPGRE